MIGGYRHKLGLWHGSDLSSWLIVCLLISSAQSKRNMFLEMGQELTEEAYASVASLSNFQTSHWVPLVKPPSLASATKFPKYSAALRFAKGSLIIREHM